MSEGVDRHAALRERTKAFASRVIRLYSHRQKSYHFDEVAMVIAKQLLRSGTSVAANHQEAKHSRSKAERIAKFNIILQELEESALWLELLGEHQMASVEALRQLLDETNQLIQHFCDKYQNAARQSQRCVACSAVYALRAMLVELCAYGKDAYPDRR